jgi:hypothetical protein
MRGDTEVIIEIFTPILVVGDGPTPSAHRARLVDKRHIISGPCPTHLASQRGQHVTARKSLSSPDSNIVTLAGRL